MTVMMHYIEIKIMTLIHSFIHSHHGRIFFSRSLLKTKCAVLFHSIFPADVKNFVIDDKRYFETFGNSEFR